MVHFRLGQIGLLLFLSGLLLGFFVPAMPRRQFAAGVHDTALLSGVFLISMSLLWSQLRLSARLSAIMARLLCVAMVALNVGLTLSAMMSDTGPDSSGLRSLLFVVNLGSSVLMLIPVTAIVLAFKRTPTDADR